MYKCNERIIYRDEFLMENISIQLYGKMYHAVNSALFSEKVYHNIYKTVEKNNYLMNSIILNRILVTNLSPVELHCIQNAIIYSQRGIVNTV